MVMKMEEIEKDDEEQDADDDELSDIYMQWDEYKRMRICLVDGCKALLCIRQFKKYRGLCQSLTSTQLASVGRPQLFIEGH